MAVDFFEFDNFSTAKTLGFNADVLVGVGVY
jgi:hypothetical protein